MILQPMTQQTLAQGEPHQYEQTLGDWAVPLLTWLEYLVVGAVGHIETAELHGHLVAARLAHGEGHLDHVGLGILQDFLGDGDVQPQLHVGDVHPKAHGPVGGEGLAVFVEQLQREGKMKKNYFNDVR